MGIIVVADLHLSIYDMSPLESFIKLLDKYEKTDNEIYLLGDTFDFYFDYRHFIPKEYFPFFLKLKETAKEKHVYIMAGNHDIWLGDFFEKYLNVHIISEPYFIEKWGKRICMMHGYAVDKKNLSKRIIESVLKSRLNSFLFSLLHPETAYILGKKVSSIAFDDNGSEKKCLKAVNAVSRSEDYCNVDNFILGHIHKTYISSDGKVNIIGDFKNNKSYAVLDEGGVHIEHI